MPFYTFRNLNPLHDVYRFCMNIGTAVIETDGAESEE